MVGVGVANAHRQTARKREFGRGGVHHTAAMSRHLEQLVGADDLEHDRRLARARVGRHHPVDVGVDLHLVWPQVRHRAAHAVVSEPPRPSVVSAPSSAMPWKPATTGTCPDAIACSNGAGLDLGDRRVAVDAIGGDARLGAGERRRLDARGAKFVGDHDRRDDLAARSRAGRARGRRQAVPRLGRAACRWRKAHPGGPSPKRRRLAPRSASSASVTRAAIAVAPRSCRPRCRRTS